MAPAVTKAVMVPADSAAAGVAGLSVCAQAEAFAQWMSYRLIGELHDAVLADEMAVGVDVDADMRLLDTTIQVAARIAVSRHVTQCAAERLLAAGLAMRDRLPAVGACLRDGLIGGYQFAAIVTRTDLVDGEHMSVVDAGIADRLRRARGGWSVAGLRTMVDRIVFRHDPDAVRRKRDAALADRGTWITAVEGGMAHVGVSMSAENARISHDAVVRLAATACRFDRRRKPARESDAMFALLSGEPFVCECDRADCDAQIPEPVHYRGVHARVVVHVVADAGTVAGEANRPGFVDGVGVISGEHVQQIVARDDTVLRPLGGDDADHPLPPHLRSDPYRPSTALDTFLKIRDGFCTVPGCTRSAWRADGDHVTEYDHDDPAAGGRTSPEGMNVKCRFHHLLKTFGDWVDDQYLDADGHTRIEVITPEGVVVDGPAENNLDLFPGLQRVRFAVAQPPPSPRVLGGGEVPRRRRPRTADKHARRRALRRRNRAEREGHRAQSGRTDPGEPPY
ncbi:DUF222 domain-containing protein [Gordonia sp. ABSL1-1]|uniref:HNH endonuclease signature motif containing protein n=1 Tax=Gordonia sp. ABSL1-1 TaxID=3053923 RepID=UPI0025737A3C|nr:HNH endonuclease signature motif containing protein [Gordonia sp. ABSL1-1]MDL9935173.1 DUF222 domain-containing protein [Gordonia sp. ABSL1-1]